MSLEGRINQALFLLKQSGYLPEDGVEDMTILTNIDEHGININLKSRYAQDQIYVSFFFLILFPIIIFGKRRM